MTNNNFVPGIQKINANGEITTFFHDEQQRSLKLLNRHKEWLDHFGLSWARHMLATVQFNTLSRINYYNELYKKILDVPGVICEFGVQYGSTLAQLINFRHLYEPYNISRIIYGFDTFKGFPSVCPEDGSYPSQGNYSSIEDYENTLEEILSLHESFSPVSHIKRYELIKGNAINTSEQWLKDNPHAIVAMAIFDMDLYEPTRDVLKNILPRLTKGSLLVFDELNCPPFPGETTALNEIIGINNLRLHKSPIQPYAAWAIYGE